MDPASGVRPIKRVPYEMSDRMTPLKNQIAQHNCGSISETRMLRFD